MSSPKIWALIIGIDYYFKEDSTTKNRQHKLENLSGCVRDATLVKAYLQNAHKTPDTQITLLTSPLGIPWDSIIPFDPASTTLPTYANIMGAFEKYLNCVKPGDHFYFHYSGHGGRARTPIPIQSWPAKGNKIDETLIPADINLVSMKGKYVRDWELAYVFGKLREMDVEVTVVMDSCCSGGVTRGPKPLVKKPVEEEDQGEERKDVNKATTSPDPTSRVKVRGYPYIDEDMYPWDVTETKFPLEAVLSVWENLQKNSSTRKTWLLQAFDYQMFPGCLQHELSHEEHGQGALSKALREAVDEAAGEKIPVTYQMLWRKLYDRIYGRLYGDPADTGDVQSPLLLGKGDRVFLGQPKDIIPHAPSIPVRALPSMRWYSGLEQGYWVVTEREDPKLILRAGKAHGVQQGEVYSIYEWTATAEDMRDPSRALGQLAVVKVQDVVSLLGRISAAKGGRMFPWKSGRQAVLLSGTVHAPEANSGPAQNPVKKVLLPVGLSIPGIAPAGSIYYNGPVQLELGTDFQDADYRIAYDDGVLQLLEGNGQRIPNVPEYSTSEVIELLKSITQISQYRQRKGIRPGERDAALFKIEQQKRTINAEGKDEITFSFHNKDTAKPVNFAVYHFNPNWGVRKIFPINAEFESIDKNDKRVFHVQRPPLSEPAPKDTDIIKAMVFDGSTTFCTWEVPDLEPVKVGGHGSDVSEGVEGLGLTQRKPVEPDARPSVHAEEDKDVQETQLNRWWTVQCAVSADAKAQN